MNCLCIALPALALLCCSTSAMAQAVSANSLSFAGKAVAIDMTSCSPENSSNGKNRAIAAINSSSASSAVIQFATADPASGKFTTVADEDALGPGKVVVGAAGSAFGKGGYVAKAGQTITVTKTGAKYQAVFADIAMVDAAAKDGAAKMLTGNVSCQ